MPASALSGIRVIDFTRLLPGPYCSLVLGDLGADVIKVEQPGEGDYARTMRKNLMRGKNAYNFLVLNRNKRSVALDLKKSGGVQAARRLLKNADVLLEGFRPGVMDRLGLGYEALKKENPRLVYLSLTGYGQDGPYAQRAGHDLNYIGYAGVSELTGDPESAAVLPGLQAADLGSALFAAVGVLAALQARERTGQGQFVDISLMDSAFALNVLALTEQLGQPQRTITRGETQLTGSVPCYGIYECADGKALLVGALEAKFWETFCAKVGRPEWIPLRYPTDLKETQRVRREIAAHLKTQPRAHWLKLLEEEDSCVSPSLTPAEAIEDPHVKARGLLYDTKHPTGGDIRQVQLPLKLSQTPGRYTRPAPELGEHTGEVLSEAGYSKEEIAALKKEGAAG